MAFHGKIAVVTGGASGIGLVHARQMAEQGASVILLDLDAPLLDHVSSGHPNLIPVLCDVTDLEAVREIIQKIEAETGPIDRLVHCAAVMPGETLCAMDPKAVTQVMTINYSGMVNVVQTVLPFMVRRNAGDLIVYGSTAGIVPVSRFGAYGATKSAVNFYMNVLMNENRETNIRFQLVCPPAVDTPLINQAKDAGPRFLKDIQSTRKNLITPEFVVKTVEHCLEKGRTVSYPGPARWVRRLYPLFPSLVTKMINRQAE